jgi:hypothetical protein
MRLEITGIVNKIYPVRPVGKGFIQAVVLHQPEGKDQFNRVTAKENYYVIQTWSNSETDSRFLNNTHINKLKTCAVYLYGERWADSKGQYQYNNKLNLSDWKTE